MKILLGQTISFKENPYEYGIEAAVLHIENGGVLIDGNLIVKVGIGRSLQKSYPQAKVYDYGKSLILPGFIDCHMHYPQTGIIASYGERLIDWLNKYTFPEEIKFQDKKFARTMAEFTLNECLKNGTTTVSSFCTTHSHSVEIFFEEAQKKNMLVVAGKTCMDRNAPENLLDTVNSAYDDSEILIKKWNNKNRSKYAITPRFAPTSSPEQLEALGELWKLYPDCIMQTHIAEQKEEIEWVTKLFPKSLDYLDVYEKFGLIGKGAIFGHAIHLKKREIQRLVETESSLAHCPTSNMFIGSGIFKLKNLLKGGQKIGLATDTGGGYSFSMLRTMSSAYEMAQLSGNSIHPAQLLWLATLGSSIALNLEHRIGNLEIGKEADLIVLDLCSTEIIKNRYLRADNFWEEVFPTLMMGDERAIKETWIAGNII